MISIHSDDNVYLIISSQMKRIPETIKMWFYIEMVIIPGPEHLNNWKVVRKMRTKKINKHIYLDPETTVKILCRFGAKV